MKAILIKEEKGDASKLYLGEAELPKYSDSQILVKVKSFALNRMDILQREGRYPVPTHGSPILGVEISGTIEAVGKDVKGFKINDAVFGLMPGGGYAEYAVLDESLTMHKPERLSYQEAAAIPEVWFTAYQALFFVGEMKEGQDVLIHAGASGVGLAAIQLAKEAGAGRIFVTVGSDKKAKFCEEYGATKAINYKTQNWAEEILKETDNKGVNLLIDFIGKDYWEKNMQVLGLDSHMVILAFMSGAIVDKVNLTDLLRKRIRVEASNLRARTIDYQTKLRCAIYNNAVTKHFAKADGVLKVIVDKEFAWENIVDAHKYLESNESMGKIVVNVTCNK